MSGAGGNLLQRRDSAAAAGNLTAALEIDSQLEDAGMAADDRLTCHSCRDWSDHAHHPHTGRRITREEYAAFRAARHWIYG